MIPMQETFDTVARHLLTQEERAVDENGQCRYRVPGTDLKCAAGFLIPDDEYDECMEGYAADITSDRSLTLARHSTSLVTDLQALHDDVEPVSWKDALSIVAFNFGLDTAVLDEFPDA